VKEVRKRFTVVITFRKSNKNSPVLQKMLKMLPSCLIAVDIWVEHILAQKLLKSHGGCCFIVLPECEDLFYTLYFLNVHTNKSNRILTQGSVGAKDCA
jgi:hypothetical protein